MKCAEYRDLHELLLDGALAGPAAEEARAHAAGCGGCRGFEAECATMLAPLAGFPPGPYLPPPPAGRLPPWTAGGTLGALLVLVVLGGAIALGLRPSVPRPATETGDARPRPAAPAAPKPEAPLPPVESPFVAPGEEGQTVVGRVMAAGGREPLPGVRVLVDGVEAARSDAAGLFTVHGLALSGWRRLRLEPPGGAPIEAVLPCLPPYGHHVLEPIEAGAGLDAEVRVIGPDARPVPGARVRATRLARTSYPDGQPDFRSGPGRERLPATFEVETDAAGVAAFAGLARGSWTFQAEREGLPPSRPLRRRLEGPWIPPMSLYLDAPAVLEGRVLDDATGEPVEGALVRWTRGIDSGWAHDLRFGGSTRSGPAGAFRFPAAPAVPVLVVEALRPGSPFVGAYMAVDSTAVGRLDLRLAGTTVVAGTCVEAGTGRPASGVLLSISSELRAGYSPSTTVSYARSDGDGRFAIPGVPDSCGVAVAPAAHGPWFSIAAAGFELPRAPEVPWRIEVARTGVLRGVARDEEGRPAPACTVRAMVKLPPSHDGIPMTLIAGQSLSAADGTFRLHGLRPGPAAVFAFPARAGTGLTEFGRAGYAALTAPEPPSYVVDARSGGETPVAVVRRQAEPPEFDGFPEDATNTIRGQVLGPRGTPVDGARVHVSRGDRVGWMEGSGSYLLRIPMGDPFPVAADGSFTAEVPSTGRDPDGDGEPYTLWAFAPGFPPAVVAARVPPGGSVEGVRILFQEGATLEGRVVREDGSPAAGILLESMEDPSGRVGGPRTAVQARTAEDGTFRIAGLRARTHHVVAGRPPGPVHGVPYLVPGTGPVEMRLPPGDGVREPSLFRRTSPRTSPDPAQAPAPTASIRGRLVVSDGAEAFLRQVCAVDPLRALALEPAGSVEPGGRFEVKVAAGSRATIAAQHVDGRWAFADDIPAGTSDVVLRLGGTPTGLLRGRVVTPAGSAAGGIPVHAVLLRRPPEGPEVIRMQPTPPAAATWWLDLVPGAVRTTLAEPDGSFDLGSPPGRWAVFAGAPGDAGPTPSRASPWSAADTSPLELVLGGPGRTLAVRATGEDAATGFCAQAADARLDGFLPGPGPVLAIRLSPASPGTFHFRCLPEGPVTVVLFDYDRREAGRATAVPGEPGEPPVEVPLRK